MTDDANRKVPADALPYPIFCRGVVRKTGKKCRRLLAKFERGIVIYRSSPEGDVIPDPPSILCGRCGTLRAFRGDVPEEVGGSSGVYVNGELRGARSAA